MSEIILKDYQQKIVDELSIFPASANFSRTGSGKTFMSLFVVKNHMDAGFVKNLVIVCPPNVTGQWASNVDIVLPNLKLLEFKKSWTSKRLNEEISKVEGEGNLIVVSIYVLQNLTALLDVVDDTWEFVFDESHKIKSLGTKRKPVKMTKAAMDLSHCTPWKQILTATPADGIEGGYIDYFSQMKFLGYMPGMNVYQFKAKYAIEKLIMGTGQQFPPKAIVGYNEDVEEFKALISAVSRSYTPKYTEEDPVHIPIKIDRARGYMTLNSERAYKDLDFTSPMSYRIAKKTLTGGVVSGMDEFKEPLKYQDNTAKIDWLKEFVKVNEETVVVFYQYNVEGDQIEEMCKKMKIKYIRLDGANKHKKEDIDNKDYQVVIGQLNACGESIDGLQYKAYISIYYSMPESSVVYQQSLGRTNRVGQEIAPVYYYLLMDRTLDEKIYQLVMDKISFTEKDIEALAVEVD